MNPERAHFTDQQAIDYMMHIERLQFDGEYERFLREAPDYFDDLDEPVEDSSHTVHQEWHSCNARRVDDYDLELFHATTEHIEC